MSGFSLPKLYAEGHTDTADAYLDWAQETGFNGVRCFGAGNGWNALQPDAAVAGFGLTLEAAKRRGLYVECTVITGSKAFAEAGFTNWQPIVARVGTLCEASGNGVLELANEWNHGSQRLSLSNLTNWGHGLRVPWAIGAPTGQDEPLKQPNGQMTFAGAGGTYITDHLDRAPHNPAASDWEAIRRVRELYAVVEEYGVPVVNGEPIGADDTYQKGRRDNRPATFLAMGALNSLFGIQGVFHCQSGLACTIPSATETACARAFLEGHAVMGDEAGTFGYRNSGRAGSPVKNFLNAVRAYSFIAGKQGYTICVDYKPSTVVNFQDGWKVTETVASGEGVRVWRLAKT